MKTIPSLLAGLFLAVSTTQAVTIDSSAYFLFEADPSLDSGSVTQYSTFPTTTFRIDWSSADPNAPTTAADLLACLFGTTGTPTGNLIFGQPAFLYNGPAGSMEAADFGGTLGLAVDAFTIAGNTAVGGASGGFDFWEFHTESTGTPGTWVSSSTGVSSTPVTNGDFFAFRLQNFGANLPLGAAPTTASFDATNPIVITHIPEPSRILLLALGFLTFTLTYRKR